MFQAHLPSIEQAAIACLQSASSVPSEDVFQDLMALTLRGAGLKTFREARYPKAPSGVVFADIDLALTDGADEAWVEVKLIKDIAVSHRTATSPSQGVERQIRRDLNKLRALPMNVERVMVVIGLFKDSSNSKRLSLIESALASLGAPPAHRRISSLSACRCHADLKEIGIWMSLV